MRHPLRSIRWALLLAAGLSGGCAETALELAPAGEGLRVGVGWSMADSPVEAAREAAAAALEPLARAQPDLVLVWENWPSRDDGRQIVTAVARHVPQKRIYGGHVAWPVSTRWVTSPTVAVVAFGGGWEVAVASQGQVLGREEQVGRLLADGLSLPAARPPTFDRPDAGAPPPPTTQPQAWRAASGQLILLFGEAGGRRARRLARGLTRRAGSRLALVGGSGSGHGGSGWQYIAGRLRVDSVWAARLAGPFQAHAVRLTGNPDAAAIRRTASLATTLLSDELAGRGAPWRLVVMVASSGWLAFLKQPEEMAVDAADRLGRGSAGGALVVGWAGDSQIGPDLQDQGLRAGQFDLAMTVIEPVPARAPAGPPPPTTQPANPR